MLGHGMLMATSGMQTGPVIPAPDFWLPITRSITGYGIAVGDVASATNAALTVNLGQLTFSGEIPDGYLPYDPSFSGSWNNGTKTGNVITPENLSTSTCSVKKLSGKWYAEITIQNIGARGLAAIGVCDGTSTAQMNTIAAAGLFLYGTGLSYKTKWFDGSGATTVDWSKTNSNAVEGDIFQLYMDCDNNKLLVRKLGTGANDYYI